MRPKLALTLAGIPEILTATSAWLFSKGGDLVPSQSHISHPRANFSS